MTSYTAGANPPPGYYCGKSAYLSHVLPKASSNWRLGQHEQELVQEGRARLQVEERQVQVQGRQIVQGQHEQELVQERGLPVEEEQGQVRRAESVVDGILRGADLQKEVLQAERLQVEHEEREVQELQEDVGGVAVRETSPGPRPRASPRPETNQRPPPPSQREAATSKHMVLRRVRMPSTEVARDLRKLHFELQQRRD